MSKVETMSMEMLERLLKDIDKIGGIDASAIASRDGLLIISTLPQQNIAETMVAMSATMIGAAEVAAVELGKDIPDRVIVESKNGKIIGTGAGEKAILLVMTRPDVSLGLVLVEMKKASENIKKILG